MVKKNELDERLRIVKAYGTAEELAQVLSDIAREKEEEEKSLARKTAGLIPTLAELGEKIDKRRATPAPKPKHGL